MSIYYKRTAIEDIQRAASYIRSTFQNEKVARLVTAFLVGAITGLADAPCTGRTLCPPTSPAAPHAGCLLSPVFLFFTVSGQPAILRSSASWRTHRTIPLPSSKHVWPNKKNHNMKYPG